jgi:arginase family enzyme
MEILDFFKPMDPDLLQENELFEEACWFHALDRYTGEKPDLSGKKIALIGIEEPDEKISAANEIRKHLYRLKRAEYAEEIIDLGNFVFDYRQKSYESLGFVLSELISHNLIPVIINGRQEITYAQYLCFCYLKNYINLVTFDARLDFDLREHKKIEGWNYLQKILTEEPSYLFGYSDIGYQSHFTDSGILEFMEKLYFDMYRLGDVRASMHDFEPVLRSAHLGSWDLSAIRQSDAPGNTLPGPNGFYAEEACLLCRYAGLSSNMRSFGIFNYDPEADRDGQTAHLSAQMVWYFVDGFLNRYPESPAENKEDFLKFIANIRNNNYQIVFYKSKRTDRWWMEIPLDEREFKGSAHIMPCSYNDYLMATREEIPERWLAAAKRMS